MGVCLNPGEDAFLQGRRSEIYVDKSEILVYLNQVFRTQQKFVCVSRPRRFGKSMAADMIAAYYDRTAASLKNFADLKIGKDANFTELCGKYDVIKINMQDFLSCAQDIDALLTKVQKRVLADLLHEYPDFDFFDRADLIETMRDIYAKTKRCFVIVIDEWDSIFREYKNHREWQDKYLDFLRSWLKDKTYVGLAYMTGILPIKKYGTHSALNMFDEFSMENPGVLAEFVGFTAAEVRDLCTKYGMSYEECKAWYDGYRFSSVGEVYNPRSVVAAMLSGIYDTYWNRTETFEALKIYIDLDFEGLREEIISLMAKERRRIETGNFVNDMTTFHGKDDVLTLLVHLGYLGYDFENKSVFIPNNEIMIEYGNAVRAGGWGIVTRTLKKAEELLRATLNLDEEKVAAGIEEAHLETSHLSYNDENALAYTVSLAYYTARQKYLIVREMPTGKGFADLVFLPRPTYKNLPALIVELKRDKSAAAAIAQIKKQQYPKALEDYTGQILLVGINYNEKTRKHECAIEMYSK